LRQWLVMGWPSFDWISCWRWPEWEYTDTQGLFLWWTGHRGRGSDPSRTKVKSILFFVGEEKGSALDTVQWDAHCKSLCL
jgi:hypothetical protein